MPQRPAIVLVHGFWGGAAHWAGVIKELHKRGYKDIHAVENPLTSLADDAERTRKMVKQIHGPVILVGHSYGGAVITEMGDLPNVKALVFIAAARTFVNASVSQALFAAHQQVFLMRLNIANLAVNVVVNIAVTPTFGATGAAAALVLSEVIGVVVANFRLAMLGLSVQPVGFVLRCVPALVVSAVTAWLLVDTSVVVAGIAAPPRRRHPSDRWR